MYKWIKFTEVYIKNRVHPNFEVCSALNILLPTQRLSPDMPLQLASETILRMLRARLHHYHQGKVCLFMLICCEFSLSQNVFDKMFKLY